jgi:hypothetical protein
MAERSMSGRPALLRRLGWMVLIWTGSVLALGLAAFLMHALMAMAGVTG